MALDCEAGKIHLDQLGESVENEKPMRFDKLIQEKRLDILRLAQKYGAGNVRIFGSVARGEDGEKSDIDFLVHFEPDCSLLDHVALAQDLQDLLGRRADGVSERALHWYIRDRVLKEAVPL